MNEHVGQWLRICSVLLGALLVAAKSYALSPVWKVSKDNHTLYIGGTFHMLAPDDYPLPSGFDQAYAASSTLVFETDIRSIHTPAFQKKLMQVLMYSDGRSVASVLSSTTYASLQSYVLSRQMDMRQFNQFKPALISLSLTVMELQRLGLNAMGVDQHYSLLAEQDHKQFAQLETEDEQIAFLAEMAEGCEDDLVAYTLRDLHDMPAMVDDMRDAWRVGDMNRLELVALSGMTMDFPSIHNTLLVNRNQSWLPAIEAMVASPAVEMVLVGALHLAGEDGLLTQLQQRGYTLQQLD